MTIIFKVILIVIMILSFLAVMGEKKDKELRNNATALCITSITGFLLVNFII